MIWAVGEQTVRGIHWLGGDTGAPYKSFAILYDDYTWELIETPFDDCYIDGKNTYFGGRTVRGYLELRRIIGLSKTKAMEFINQKFEDYKKEKSM